MTKERYVKVTNRLAVLRKKVMEEGKLWTREEMEEYDSLTEERNSYLHQNPLPEVKPKKVGRPKVGITKKCSITLPEEQWAELETIMKMDKASMSQALREIIGVYMRLDSDRIKIDEMEDPICIHGNDRDECEPCSREYWEKEHNQ